MYKYILLIVTIVVLYGCATKTGVRMDAGATNHYSSGRILFSQPF